MKINNPIIKNNLGKCPAFIYPIVEKNLLKIPPVNFISYPTKVFLNRRSSRAFSQISLNTLSKVLWITNKVKNSEVRADGYILSHRPVPSAGSIHPIDIVISFPNKSRNLFYYNPFDHSINKLKIDKQIFKSFLKHLESFLDFKKGIIIWFVAHPIRTESKYKNASSLIWRDAGALIFAFQFACTCLNINSCPIGSLGEPYFSKLFEKSGTVYGVGGLLIG